MAITSVDDLYLASILFLDAKPFIIYHFSMKTMEITDIDEMLLKLPARRLQEVRDYVGFLLEIVEPHKGCPVSLSLSPEDCFFIDSSCRFW